MKYSIVTLALLAAPFASAGALSERGALSEIPDCAVSTTPTNPLYQKPKAPPSLTPPLLSLSLSHPQPQPA